MEENEEAEFEFRTAQFRDALMRAIRRHGRIGREQVLDMVFRAYDKAMTELIHTGKVVVEKAPGNESHLDMFVLAAHEK